MAIGNNTPQVNQRNPTNTGTNTYWLTVPGASVQSIFFFRNDISPPEPWLAEIGSGLSANVAGAMPQLSVDFSGCALLAGSYVNPAFISTLDWSKITNVSLTSLQVTNGLGFAPYNGTTNPNNYITLAAARTGLSITTTGTSGAATYNSSTGVLNVPIYAPGTGTVTSITAGTGLSGGTITTTGTISLPNTGTAGSYNNVTTDAQGRVTAGSTIAYLTGNQTVTLSGDVTGSGATAITATLANTGTAGTYSGVTTDAKGRVTSGTTRSFNNAPGRSIVTVAASANGFQISSTRDSAASYSVTINTSSTLSGGSAGYVVLEICPTNSAVAANWIEIARTADGQANGLIVGLTLNQVGGGVINGIVPATYYARLRSVNTTGTPSYTYNSGQEVLL